MQKNTLEYDQFVSKYTLKKIELKSQNIFFPESLGQKHGCTVYTGAHHTQQNTVLMNG